MVVQGDEGVRRVCVNDWVHGGAAGRCRWVSHVGEDALVSSWVVGQDDVAIQPPRREVGRP